MPQVRAELQHRAAELFGQAQGRSARRWRLVFEARLVELSEELGEPRRQVRDGDPATLARPFAQQIEQERDTGPVAIADPSRIHPQRRRPVLTDSRARFGPYR